MTENSTMLAGAYLGNGRIEAVEKPQPVPGTGEVLVKVSRAGICGTDMHTYRHGGYTPEGLTIGHEFSGRVAALGEGVTGVELGERVTANPMCDHLGLFRDGAFAEYVIVPNARAGENLFGLPDNIDDEQGALIEPLAVALRGINQIQLETDTTMLIQGLGTIGLCALLVARQRGVRNIVAVDLPGSRLELAARLGATTVALGEQDLANTLNEQFGQAEGLLGGPKLDLVIDATGSEQALATGIDMLAPHGQIVILGTYAAPITVDMTLFVAKELRMYGSLAYQGEFAEALALVASGAVDVRPLVSHRFALAEIDRAFAQQADAAASIKVILTVDE